MARRLLKKDDAVVAASDNLAKQIREEDKPKYVTCQACDLNQQRTSVEANDGRCMRCSEPVDMKGQKSSKLADELGKAKEAAQPAKPAENLSLLCDELFRLGYQANLTEIAALKPVDRERLRAFAFDKAPPPIDVLPVRRLTGTVEGPPPPEKIKADEHARASAAENIVSKRNAKTATFVGDEVTVVHGQEIYRVTDFCSFHVGPFTLSAFVRAGETRIECLQRLSDELEEFVAIERVRRRDKYIAALKGVKAAVKEG